MFDEHSAAATANVPVPEDAKFFARINVAKSLATVLDLTVTLSYFFNSGIIGL